MVFLGYYCRKYYDEVFSMFFFLKRTTKNSEKRTTKNLEKRTTKKLKGWGGRGNLGFPTNIDIINKNILR
jgi:hypothetical protein